jgi:transcriptional regulator with XRE-family HTH domain
VVDPLVAARVKALRERKGWKQADLAAAAGVATNTVGGLERGRQTRWPKFVKIAGALRVTTHALQTGEGLTDDNPLLKKLRLSDEDLRIAKRFHDAETAIRLLVERLLRVGERDPMLVLWNRVEHLRGRRKDTLLQSLTEHEKAQAAEDAAKSGRRKPKKP